MKPQTTTYLYHQRLFNMMLVQFLHKLTALREGRETFILGESSERIRRALSNNV